MVVFETAGLLALAAGIAVFGGALGTAWAQASIGASAMGVIAERPEDAMKLIIWIAIPETIVIFGFVVGMLLILKIPALA